MDILNIDGRTWQTPFTRLPLRTVGTARLKRTHYRGTYHYEGVRGYEYWRTGHWLPVVSLQQRTGRQWKTWMVDDPLHWDGMRERVGDLPPGRILVAGLGLGLMLHHMCDDRRFTAITVVELNPDVVDLIRPTLPDDPRVRIVVGDFNRYIQDAPRSYDGVLWDLAVGQPDETWVHFTVGRALVQHFLPGVPLVQFGLKKRL